MTVTCLLSYNLNGITDNFDEIVLEAGTTNEGPVYIGVSHEFRDVG